MSPTGALMVSITLLIILGAIAAWLMNVPGWAIALMVVVSGGVSRWLVRRVTTRRARQNTETPT